jgi:2,4-dienoyl-CoA reductase-like NADH-dependent reductase (Old Yellow Enzyme family)/thioredoxin reductase
MNYPNLFQPMWIGSLRLKNRIFAAPLQMSFLDGNGYYTDYTIRSFQEKARGGAALVTVGDTPVDSRYAASTYRHPVLDDPGTLPSLTELVRSIHEYGAAASVEVNHAGAMAHPQYITGPNPIGPVDDVRKDGQFVKGMDEELMAYTLDSFAQAAAMAKLAGFDLITVQMGHGWLLHQFLSPRTNTRKDQYGGSLRNRCRFPLEVLARIRKVVGPEFPIQISVSGAEHIKGGDTLQNTIEFCKMAQPYVDLIHVTASVNTDSRAATIIHSTPYQPHELLTHYAAAIKKATGMPVVAVGGILSPGEAEGVLERGEADAVAMGRALIADPFLPYKAKHQREEEIRPCLRCLTCLDEMSRSRSFCCTVNPLAGREFRLLNQSSEPKAKMRLAVIGGGPAGMSAALSAADNGHTVTLIEQSGQLGGLLRRTLSAPCKSDTAAYLNYLERAVRKTAGIQICLNTEATPENVSVLAPQGVIMATGSLSRKGELPGADSTGVLDVAELYQRPVPSGQRVVIVGGGVSGCEAALYLAKLGKQVTVVEQGTILMSQFSRLPRIALLDQLAAQKVECCTGLRVTEVTSDGVQMRDTGGKVHRLEADVVVVANGRQGDSSMVRRFSAVAPTVVAIGGCQKSGSLYHCINQGFFAGRNLEFY